MRPHVFQFAGVRRLFEPRKPRNPLVRMLAGLVGLGILAVAIFFSVFVGAAMILGGIAWKLFSSSRKRRAESTHIVEGEYQVVRKQALPFSH